MYGKTNIAQLEDLGRELRKRRKGLRLTQQDVADMCGVQRQTIGRLEGGDPTIAIDTLVAAASSMGLDIVAVPRTPDRPIA